MRPAWRARSGLPPEARLASERTNNGRKVSSSGSQAAAQGSQEKPSRETEAVRWSSQLSFLSMECGASHTQLQALVSHCRHLSITGYAMLTSPGNSLPSDVLKGHWFHSWPTLLIYFFSSMLQSGEGYPVHRQWGH